jgi:hypothetical protein
MIVVAVWTPNTMSNKSLATLVAIYRRQFGRRLDAYLDYFMKLDSLDKAIRFACHSKEGKIHDHQYRVGKETLEQASKALQRHSHEIKACVSFDDLLSQVEDHTRRINRFGVLAVYDTSLRLGAKLGLWPEVVHLHAGTKKGCKALGLATKGRTLDMATLPLPIRALEPYHAENFLCIFKGQFGGKGGKATECGQSAPPPSRH